jgi:hypothetical protein
MSFELTYPDGMKEIVLNVPKYNFNWQIMILRLRSTSRKVLRSQVGLQRKDRFQANYTEIVWSPLDKSWTICRQLAIILAAAQRAYGHGLNRRHGTHRDQMALRILLVRLQTHRAPRFRKPPSGKQHADPHYADAYI